jgi:hypothetical protein
MKKILLVLILISGFTFNSFGQSEKLKEKATEQVEKLNSEIVSGDASAALSDEQKEQVYNLHIERIKELRTSKKEGATDEEVKAINKKYYQKINKEILTKEQIKARKIGRQKK